MLYPRVGFLRGDPKQLPHRSDAHLPRKAGAPSLSYDPASPCNECGWLRVPARLPLTKCFCYRHRHFDVWHQSSWSLSVAHALASALCVCLSVRPPVYLPSRESCSSGQRERGMGQHVVRSGAAVGPNLTLVDFLALLRDPASRRDNIDTASSKGLQIRLYVNLLSVFAMHTRDFTFSVQPENGSGSSKTKSTIHCRKQKRSSCQRTTTHNRLQRIPLVIQCTSYPCENTRGVQLIDLLTTYAHCRRFLC